MLNVVDIEARVADKCVDLCVGMGVNDLTRDHLVIEAVLHKRALYRISNGELYLVVDIGEIGASDDFYLLFFCHNNISYSDIWIFLLSLQNIVIFRFIVYNYYRINVPSCQVIFLKLCF